MKSGVLLTGYGGPDSLDAVGPFMKNLMGCEPTPELVERVKRALSRDRRRVAAHRASPSEIAAGLGMRRSASRVTRCRSAVGMALLGALHRRCACAPQRRRAATRVIAVSLSPFESKVAHGKYREAIDEAAESIGGLEVVEAPLVSELDEYAAFFAGATAVSLTDIAAQRGHRHRVLGAQPARGGPRRGRPVRCRPRGGRRTRSRCGSACPRAPTRSFPMLRRHRDLRLGRRAPGVVSWRTSRRGTARALGSARISTTSIAALAGTEVKGVVVVPIGFMTDHMETLYDLDIVAAEQGARCRTRVRAGRGSQRPPRPSSRRSPRSVAELA